MQCIHLTKKDLIAMKARTESITGLAELADVLGHSRIDTTRLYTATTDAEYRKKLDGLRLV